MLKMPFYHGKEEKVYQNRNLSFSTYLIKSKCFDGKKQNSNLRKPKYYFKTIILLIDLINCLEVIVHFQ